MGQKKEMGLVKSIFSYSIASWVNIIIGLLYTVLSTRLLEPETYGMVSVFMNASNTLMYVICLGLDASFIRFFNERPNKETINNFSFKLISLITVIFFAVFFISTVFMFDWFNQFMFGRTSWLLTVLLYSSVYSNLLLRFFNIIYRMTFNVKQYTIQNVLIQSSNKVLIILAAFLNPTYEQIITFQVVGLLLITVTYVFIQRKDVFPSKDENHLSVKYYDGYGPIIRFALFSAPTYISANMNVLLVQQVIRGTLGGVDLGIYSSVHIFATLYGAIQTGFSNFWAAYVYKNYDDEHEKISSMTEYVMLVGIVSIAGFVVFRRLLYLFIGKDYQEGIYFFAMVLMVNVFSFLSQATIYGIDIVKKNYITAISNCIYIGVNALFVFLGGKCLGLVGVAYGVMFASFLLFIVNTIIGQKYYKTINNKMRFFYAVLSMMIIAATPSLSFVDSRITYLFIFIVIISTVGVYKKEYMTIFGLVRNRILKQK